MFFIIEEAKETVLNVSNDTPIFENILSSVAKKRTDLARDLGKNFLDKQIDRLNKEYITGSGISLTNNEIKDILKVIKFLENKRINTEKNYYKNYCSRKRIFKCSYAINDNLLTINENCTYDSI